MAQGRISRAHQQQAASRRHGRSGGPSTRHAARKLPPHLLKGSPTRTKKSGPITIPRIAMLTGAIALVAGAVFFVFTIITAAAGVAGTVNAYQSVNAELPNAAEIAVGTFQTSRILDRDGELLQEVDNPNWGWRTYAPLDEISPLLIDATVAAEDASFWTNQGVAPVGIVRAAFINIAGTGSSGASTITQQLVRSLYPEEIGYDVSYTRKGREALAAVALAQQYSKSDIMSMYLNTIYYGNRAYGIQAAAQTYFDVNASDLTLAQATFLAGLPQSPTYYAENFDQAKIRQEYVLEQMVSYRYISASEARDAYAEPLQPEIDRSGAVQNAPHFTQYVREYIVENFGEDALYGGLEITTTIDLDLQQVSEEIVAAGVADMVQFQRNNGAVVIMVPWSGEILAMVGSADFNDSLISGQVNFATSPIQPGSSIKPLVYAAAFEEGWHPATVVLDVPTTWDSPGQDEPYEPNNYTKRFYGGVTVRTALANSLNIPAVKAVEYAGLTNVMGIIQDMGLRESINRAPDFYGLALGLGSGEVQLLEHTNAYSTLANNGTYVPAHPILEIKDSQGNILYELDEEQIAEDSDQVIGAGQAYQVSSILTDDEAREMVFGAGNLFEVTQQQLGRPVAAKSGTTENWKDLWTMGYTTDVSIGVWVGRSGDTNEVASLPELDGSEAAGPIWQDLMTRIHDTPEFADLLVGPDGQAMPEEFPQPEEVVRGEVCAATGNRATGGSTVTDWLVRGNEPTNACGDLTEYQQEELEKSLESSREGGISWASGAVESVNRYAQAAGERGISGGSSSTSSRDEDDEDDEENGGAEIESEENGDGESPAIEEIDPDD